MLALTTLVVRDYDEAIAFFTDALGWRLREDRPMPGKRWVVVAPAHGRGGGLLLARAATPEQAARIGDQTGGRVAFFLESDDFARDHARMLAAGVRFLEVPRDEAYGRVAVFLDLHGNRWDLVQHHARAVIQPDPIIGLREASEADAGWVLRLVNDPAWLAHIGDRGVRDLDDARAYLRRGPMAMVARFGFGLWVVQRLADGQPLGLCGLLQREGVEGVDIGYALLPEARGAGHARRAAALVMQRARHEFGLERLRAFVSVGNDASLRLLAALGFRDDGRVVLPGESEELVRLVVEVGSSRVDLQACKLEYSIVSPK